MASSDTTRVRRRRIVLSAIGAFLLFVVIASQQAFNLAPLRPETLQQTFVFAALSAIIFLGLLALTFVLLRTIVKLYLDKQAGVLGYKFRTKMVLGALVLSFGPVIALFLFSYGLMNRSINTWFSRPVEEVSEHTQAVTSLLSNYAGQNALAEARAIASSPDTQRAFVTGSFGSVMEEFRRREVTMQDGFAFAMKGSEPQASFHAPQPWYQLRGKLPLVAAVTGHPSPFALDGREYMLAATPVGDTGRIVVAMPLPSKYSETLKALDASQRRYFQLRSENKIIRVNYVQFLLLITLLVLFASTWFALTLSKLVTRPVSALAEATHEISRGRLDYRVEVAAGDELAELVASFNTMAGELESNRHQIESSQAQLSDANVQLEQRRRYMETILESIPSGVLSVEAEGTVTRVNAALLRMFHPHSFSESNLQSGVRLRDLFSADVASELERMMRKADRMGTTIAQMEIPSGAAMLNVGVTVASMDSVHRDRAQRFGYVIVFEDLSDLLKAQKQAAWREVARRIAHEIKNPLTPITLSAERIRRHLGRGFPDEASVAVLNSCAATIAEAAETVRTLVDEFATLARFPQSQLQPANLNAIVENSLAMFDGRLEGITICRALSPDLPPVMADPEAVRRVVANLMDNAAEAMKDALVREITISTAVLSSRDAVELVVSDTGHGITPELKEKLFLPYFSTKQRGTGLGLAIVSRIVEDHHGNIRVEENSPVGARFIVELPLATDTADRSSPAGGDSVRVIASDHNS